jgi:hypothetical protein
MGIIGSLRHVDIISLLVVALSNLVSNVSIARNITAEPNKSCQVFDVISCN